MKRIKCEVIFARALSFPRTHGFRLAESYTPDTMMNPIYVQSGRLTKNPFIIKMMRKAEKDNLRFLVSRRGKPKVVILSVEDYLQNIIKQPEILARIQLSAKEAGLDKMTDVEINDEISAVRQKAEK